MSYNGQIKHKLMKRHQKMMGIGQPIMTRRFGYYLAATAVAESDIEFQNLIPQIPSIGGKDNPMTDTLVQMTSLLALYRVLKRHGRDVTEIGDIAYEMAQAWVAAYPQFARHIIGKYYMSRFNRKRQKQKAINSQKRQYPGDFVIEFVEGNNNDFDWGINFVECGVVKFFAEQDASEFTPAMCRIDYLLFPALGIDLQRTGTIAQGCTHCDFRFR
jgi:hypothetical protein